MILGNLPASLPALLPRVLHTRPPDAQLHSQVSRKIPLVSLLCSLFGGILEVWGLEGQVAFLCVSCVLLALFSSLLHSLFLVLLLQGLRFRDRFGLGPGMKEGLGQGSRPWVRGAHGQATPLPGLFGGEVLSPRLPDLLVPLWAFFGRPFSDQGFGLMLVLTITEILLRCLAG